MKKLLKVWSLGLALALLAAPIAACGESRSEEEPELRTEIPEITESKTPDQPQEQPQESETPKVDIPTVEIPQVSEEPEKPEEPEIPKEPEKPVNAQYIRILTNGLNVRAGAGTGYASLGQVEKGVLLDFKQKSGNWYETTFRGQKAYVSADSKYTALSELALADEKIEAVINEGLKYLGVPYVYGATRLHDGKGNMMKGFTTAQFDCSSLMQYIFYKGANVLLDVTTRTQIKQGKSVAASDLQRGDLLFFTNASRYNNTGLERVGHVALYLGGNYILHTASDYAKIEQISGQRWSYFLEARRVL